ncbi:MAG: DEAD/DEAH box helicase [Clostridium sp.]
MELRPYQAEAKAAVFEQWDKGAFKTLLVLPTGCGKTIVFAKVAEDCVRQGYRVLILAHRGELLEQAADKIKKSTNLDVRQKKQSRPVWGAGSGSQ